MSSDFLFYLTWIFLGSTGLSLGLTWWKFSRSPVQPLGRILSLWTALVLTASYSYFLVAIAVSLTPWSQMLDQWWLFRKPEAVALLNVFLGLAAVAVTLLKRGPGRAQIIWSGALLSALSLLLFYGLSLSQI